MAPQHADSDADEQTTDLPTNSGLVRASPVSLASNFAASFVEPLGAAAYFPKGFQFVFMVRWRVYKRKEKVGVVSMIVFGE